MHYNLSDEQKIFLHVSYSMLEEGYDVDQIMEFWNLDDESKITEICESITLSETIDTSNPDLLLICEKGGIQAFLMRLFGRGGRGVKVKPPVVKPPANKPPATTKGGRPITSSTGRGTTKPDATKPPVSGGQKPSLGQRVRDLNNKIPPKVRTGAAVLGAAGLSVLGGKIGMDNNLIPGIPDTPSKPEEPTGDPLANGNDNKDNSGNNGNNDNNGNNSSETTRAERKRRNYAWASINNRPPNFYRNDPAYYHTRSKYNNIRGNPIPKEYTKDHYEVIADYLIAEGHASDIEEANYVMQQLDEDFIQSIIENK